MSFKKLAMTATLLTVATIALMPSAEAATKRTKISYSSEEAMQDNSRVIAHTRVAKNIKNEGFKLKKKRTKSKYRNDIRVTAQRATPKSNQTLAQKEDAKIAATTPMKAIEESQAAPAELAPSQPGLNISTRVRKPSTPDYKFGAALKNIFTSARRYELELQGDKAMDALHELNVEVKHKSGWGTGLSQGYSYASFDDGEKNTGGATDLTMRIFHPTILKTDSFSWNGVIRTYFPTSEGSQANGRTRFAYYTLMNLKLAAKLALDNALITRFHTFSKQADSDVMTYVEDEVALQYEANSWMTLALANNTTWSTPRKGDVAIMSQMSPYISFSVSDNVYVEPRGYFPVYVSPTEGGPNNASLDNIAAELYLKLSI